MNKYIKKGSLNSLHYPKVSKVDFYSLDFLFRSLALFSLLFLPFIFVFFLSFSFASTNSIHFSRFIDSITRSVALKVLLSIWQKDVHFSDSFNVCGFSRRSFSTLDMYRFMLSHSLASSWILVRSCFASSLLLHFLRMRPLLRCSIHFSLHLHTIVFNRHSNISQLSLSPIFICFNLHSLRSLSLSLSPSAYAGSVSFSVGQAIYFPTLMCEPHLKFSKLYTDQKQSEDLLHYGQIMFRSTLGVK